MHSIQYYYLRLKNQLVQAGLNRSFKVIKFTIKYFSLPKGRFYQDYKPKFSYLLCKVYVNNLEIQVNYLLV